VDTTSNWQDALDEGLLAEHMFFTGLQPLDVERLARDERFADRALIVRLRSFSADGRTIMTPREILAWRAAPTTPLLASHSSFIYDDIRDIYPR
jgi:hypothetical protein